MNIKIDFRNFWDMFVPKSGDFVFDFIHYFFSTNSSNITIDSENPDVIFYSVFGEPIIDNNAVKILLSLENLYTHKYAKKYLPILDKFDFVLSFHENPSQSHYKIPYYLISGKLYDTSSIDYKIIQQNTVNLNQKHRNICLISQNSHKLRLDLILKFLNKNVVIDCPGKVGNNMTMPKDNNKLKLLDTYFFNICPENSWTTGYTTEKLYHAMISGCIPIYWGCDKLDDGFYNKEKVLLIYKDLSNIDAIVDETIKILNNPNKLRRYICMNPFGKNRLDIISDQNKKINNIFKQIIK